MTCRCWRAPRPPTCSATFISPARLSPSEDARSRAGHCIYCVFTITQRRELLTKVPAQEAAGCPRPTSAPNTQLSSTHRPLRETRERAERRRVGKHRRGHRTRPGAERGAPWVPKEPGTHAAAPRWPGNQVTSIPLQGAYTGSRHPGVVAAAGGQVPRWPHGDRHWDVPSGVPPDCSRQSSGCFQAGPARPGIPQGAHALAQRCPGRGLAACSPGGGTALRHLLSGRPGTACSVPGAPKSWWALPAPIQPSRQDPARRRLSAQSCRSYSSPRPPCSAAARGRTYKSEAAANTDAASRRAQAPLRRASRPDWGTQGRQRRPCPHFCLEGWDRLLSQPLPEGAGANQPASRRGLRSSPLGR